MTVPAILNTPFCTVVSTCRHVQQTLNGLSHHAMNTFGKSMEGAQHCAGKRVAELVRFGWAT